MRECGCLRAAVRSASPMTSQTNGHQAGIVGGGEGGSKSDEQWQEVTGLKAELTRLQQQLAKSDDAVKLLQERERLLISRYVTSSFSGWGSRFVTCRN